MINSEFFKEFKEAYKASRNDDIDFINEFCEKWENSVNLEHIPYVMKLFYGDALNSAQNEYVGNILDNVIKKNMTSGSQKVIENMDILSQEKSILCITDLVTILVVWNEASIETTAREFAKCESTLKKEIRLEFLKRVSMKKDCVRKKFEFYYEEEKKKMEKGKNDLS